MENKKPSFPLMLANIGESYTVVRIIGDEKTIKHLHNIGFYSGANIKIISKTNGGLMINLMDAKLALDSNICSKIYVSVLEQKNQIEMEK